MSNVIPFTNSSLPGSATASAPGDAAATGIRELRMLLRHSFPNAGELPATSSTQEGTDPIAMGHAWGVPALQAAGLQPGMLAEAVCLPENAGSGLLLAGMLDGAATLGAYTALVDGRDAFDPASVPAHEAAQLFRRMLWVRCRAVDEVIKAADWLLRDGNLSLVVLDLQLNPLRELQKQPASVWYRLRALTEHSRATCLALTPCRSVAAAQVRLEFSQRAELDLLELPRTGLVSGLVSGLQPRITRQRLHTIPRALPEIAALAG